MTTFFEGLHCMYVGFIMNRGVFSGVARVVLVQQGSRRFYDNPGTQCKFQHVNIILNISDNGSKIDGSGTVVAHPPSFNYTTENDTPQPALAVIGNIAFQRKIPNKQILVILTQITDLTKFTSVD